MICHTMLVIERLTKIVTQIICHTMLVIETVTQTIHHTIMLLTERLREIVTQIIHHTMLVIERLELECFAAERIVTQTFVTKILVKEGSSINGLSPEGFFTHHTKVRHAKTVTQRFVTQKLSHNSSLRLTVYRFPLIASVIRIPFAKGSLDLIEIWTLVSRNLPLHMSITMTSSPSLAVIPHAQNPGFLDLLHAQKRV